RAPGPVSARGVARTDGIRPAAGRGRDGRGDGDRGARGTISGALTRLFPFAPAGIVALRSSCVVAPFAGSIPLVVRAGLQSTPLNTPEKARRGRTGAPALLPQLRLIQPT